jgi:hypothetical protein
VNEIRATPLGVFTCYKYTIESFSPDFSDGSVSFSDEFAAPGIGLLLSETHYVKGGYGSPYLGLRTQLIHYNLE